MDRSGIFHGITAVAELKAASRPRGWGWLRSIFHGITAVAELKGFLGLSPARRILAFSTASPPWPN